MRRVLVILLLISLILCTTNAVMPDAYIAIEIKETKQSKKKYN